METEIKWAEVAHYYQKSEILIQTNDVGIREMLGAQGTRGVMYATRAHAMLSRWGQHKPILRALEDMTEDEAMELWNSVLGRVAFDESLYSPYGTPLRMYLTKADFWLPNEFHWLISKGFDVFGLIASGQAVRKET